MTTTTTPTFHPFPRLSFELRTAIWELTVEPRIVEVRVVTRYPKPAKTELSNADAEKWSLNRPLRHLRSSTAAPVQLQVCREAREYLTTHPKARCLYSRAFSELAQKTYDGSDTMLGHDPELVRYVWLNLDLDVVSIGDADVHEFEAVGYQIKRLRLERLLDDEYFARSEVQSISKVFRNLREIQMVCSGGIRDGYRRTEDDDYAGLGPENVYFLDPEHLGGSMMNSVDLDAMVTKEYLSGNALEDLEGCIPTELWEELMMQQTAREQGQ
ncbi:hypothetical protein IFR05_002427 [Cadophora sp. M221]|nr:hypothetical protein IFR05_002427 [Cadophora sp. M221]